VVVHGKVDGDRALAGAGTLSSMEREAVEQLVQLVEASESLSEDEAGVLLARAERVLEAAEALDKAGSYHTAERRRERIKKREAAGMGLAVSPDGVRRLPSIRSSSGDYGSDADGEGLQQSVTSDGSGSDRDTGSGTGWEDQAVEEGDEDLVARAAALDADDRIARLRGMAKGSGGN